jgi:TolA-binding protein
VTPAEERQIKDDIALLQTRLVQVENKLSIQNKSIANRANKSTASTNTRIDRLIRDIQKIKGEIDTLRVGVITGRLPGTSEENQGSVARTLEVIQERLKEAEETQQEILRAIDKASQAEAKKKKANRGPKITSLKELQRAFDEKRFRHVGENGAAVLKRQSAKSDKQQALYLYAESLYKLGRLREAALKFNDYLEMKPSRHVAHAKMRMGDCFRHLGDPGTARMYYQELISQHKNSDEAKTAKDRLAKLSD